MFSGAWATPLIAYTTVHGAVPVREMFIGCIPSAQMVPELLIIADGSG